MKTIKTSRPVNAALLGEELQRAFPDLQLGTTLNIRTWGAGWPDHADGDIEITTPDNYNEAAVLAIVQAHDAKAPTAEAKAKARAVAILTRYKGQKVGAQSVPQVSEIVEALALLAGICDEVGRIKQDTAI